MKKFNFMLILIALLYSPTASAVTLEQYNKIKSGMTYQQVIEIVGEEGEELSNSSLAGYVTIMYMWQNYTGSNMNTMFQNGKLISKAQFGLR